jgi:hypothetical protein
MNPASAPQIDPNKINARKSLLAASLPILLLLLFGLAPLGRKKEAARVTAIFFLRKRKNPAGSFPLFRRHRVRAVR